MLVQRPKLGTSLCHSGFSNVGNKITRSDRAFQVPLMWVTSTSNAFTGRYLAPIVERCKLSQHSLGAAESCSFSIPASSATTPSTSRRLHVTEPVASNTKVCIIIIHTYIWSSSLMMHHNVLTSPLSNRRWAILITGKRKWGGWKMARRGWDYGAPFELRPWSPTSAVLHLQPLLRWFWKDLFATILATLLRTYHRIPTQCPPIFRPEERRTMTWASDY